LMRIRFMAALAFSILTLSVVAPAQRDPLIASTQQGQAKGKWLANGKVKAFLVLPYAAPPVGPLRWRAPQPPAAWTGVRQAAQFSAHCAQLHFYDDILFQDAGGSEDCLYLNVYAPANAAPRAKLPVMFWIHGGNFDAGSASEPRHSGGALPQKGVVLVTVNYRLGVFGFLATSELAKEGGGAAGNYGLMDMIAALGWVKANIAAFGGDPANVTIFGESAGAYAVSELMASPLARGLFQKAIGESGSAFPRSGASLPLAENVQRGDRWLASLHENSIATLRTWNTESVIEAAKNRIGGMPVYIDGKVLTEPIEATYAAGRQAQIPLLIGWNRDDSDLPLQGMSAWRWRRIALDLFGARAERFLELYPGRSDAEANRSAIDYGGDQFVVFPAWKWWEAQRKSSKEPIYRYRFDLPAPPSKFHAGGFAFHSDEIEYVFGALDARPGARWRDQDRKMSALLMSYWTNFAKRGDPNGAGLPVWPKVDREEKLLRLGEAISVETETQRARYQFLQEGLPPMLYKW
jgi:para-nitrobenzyl esterase